MRSILSVLVIVCCAAMAYSDLMALQASDNAAATEHQQPTNLFAIERDNTMAAAASSPTTRNTRQVFGGYPYGGGNGGYGGYGGYGSYGVYYPSYNSYYPRYGGYGGYGGLYPSYGYGSFYG